MNSKHLISVYSYRGVFMLSRSINLATKNPDYFSVSRTRENNSKQGFEKDCNSFSDEKDLVSANSFAN